MEKIQLYWVSVLEQPNETDKPIHIGMQNACVSMEEAKALIESCRIIFRILSAWIDTFDEDNKKTTVYHACYIDAAGNVEKPVCK